jgi:hypothetical protein
VFRLALQDVANIPLAVTPNVFDFEALLLQLEYSSGSLGPVILEKKHFLRDALGSSCTEHFEDGFALTVSKRRDAAI